MSQNNGVSRRTFLTGLGFGAAATVLPWRPARAQASNVIGAQAHTYEAVADWGRLPAGVQFGNTHGVQVDSNGRVYIHNQSKDAVAIFDSEGKWIKSWGPQFAAGAHGIQLVREGNEEFLYLADFVRHIVVKITLDGEEIWKVAGWPNLPRETWVPNKLIAPHGACWVVQGNIYVSEYIRTACVTKCRAVA